MPSRTKRAASTEQAQQKVIETLRPLGLELNPGKTRIVHLKKGAEGFDFLGFHCRKVESWKWRGRFYLQRWPSAEAMKSIRGRVRVATERSQALLPIEDVARNLSSMLRSWGEYFRYGNSGRKFAQIDSYVHQRLAIFASTKHGLPGHNWRPRFDGNWLKELGVYRLSGTVRYRTANAWR